MSRRLTIVSVVLALALAAPARAAVPCPADLDCSGAVTVDDLVGVIVGWGGTGGRADIDGSGQVDVDDLVAVITAWGSCLFEYPPAPADTEAYQIAMEMLGPGGALLPSPAAYERVDRDLDLIRTAVPELAGETHSMAWAPDRLLVQVQQGADLAEYECTNVYYQVIDENLLFSSGGFDWYVLTLAGRINVEALAQVYMALDEVGVAEPDGLFGGQNYWEPTILANDVWQWSIDDGWHDCFDGCDCHRFYEIRTDGPGSVSVVSFQEVGQSWCEFE